jgi:hypothetical protein
MAAVQDMADATERLQKTFSDAVGSGVLAGDVEPEDAECENAGLSATAAIELQ